MSSERFNELWLMGEQAHWAMVAAVAAVLGIFLTAAGLIFIWRQLRIAELNARAAVDAAHAALLAGRPWVQARVTEHSRMVEYDNDAGKSVQCQITLINFGNAPAIDVRVTLRKVRRKDWALEGEALSEKSSDHGFTRGIIPPGGELLVEIGYGAMYHEHADAVVVMANYRVPGISERKYSTRVYQYSVGYVVGNDQLGLHREVWWIPLEIEPMFMT